MIKLLQDFATVVVKLCVHIISSPVDTQCTELVSSEMS